ncbi:DUF5719 family protein [Leifsonia flava]|uniref:Large extracellular alpha-helical protein n=1 Tax=Orlajensenia leifsoniae TaxID=2561933 RepID=A0A4Y9QYX6_9MICO|nr:DUF5719 family protein [Leifsonia flava]TFV96483.1 hypothetical protein E4M00_14320 [Leifsonia flava]
MSTKRRIAVVGGRSIAGLAGIAIAVGAVTAAVLVPWPSYSVTPVAQRVVPVPTDAQRVCPGPILALAEDATQATAASSIGSANVTAAAASGEPDPEESSLDAPDNDAADSDGGPTLVTVPAAADATEPPLVAASQSQVASTDTQSGLAVAACTEAVPDAWLVGGSTEIGRTTLVLLTNSSSVLATVDLAVYGESGPIDAPGSTGILVQPKSQRVVSLAGLAPDVASPVVHVTASGGEVAASLQQSTVRGLEPGGVDIVGPTADPDTTALIAGLTVSSSTAADPDAQPGAEEGYSDEQPGLRLLVPGDTGTQATVSVVGEDGAPGTSFTVDLEPGVSIEAPLTDLGSGAYTVRVEADQPVVAAARSAVSGNSGRDFGWFTASSPLTDEPTLVAAARGASPVLHAWNPSGEDATVVLTSERGTTRELDLPAATALSFEIDAGAGYEISDAAGIIASIGYETSTRLASFAVNPVGGLAAPVIVYTR